MRVSKRYNLASPALQSSEASSVESGADTSSNGKSSENVEDDEHGPKARERTLTTVSRQSVINVNKNEAEQWLKVRIGPQYSIK